MSSQRGQISRTFSYPGGRVTTVEGVESLVVLAKASPETNEQRATASPPDPVDVYNLNDHLTAGPGIIVEASGNDSEVKLNRARAYFFSGF